MRCKNNENLKTHSVICNLNNTNRHLVQLQIDQYFLSAAVDFNQQHTSNERNEEKSVRNDNLKVISENNWTYALL